MPLAISIPIIKLPHKTALYLSNPSLFSMAFITMQDSGGYRFIPIAEMVFCNFFVTSAGNRDRDEIFGPIFGPRTVELSLVPRHPTGSARGCAVELGRLTQCDSY